MERYLVEFAGKTWEVLLDLSPALLLGLFFAGLLHAFVPKGLIRRHISQSKLGDVVRAVLVGVPMPLCSCGVLPTALELRRQGASSGAAAGFLISTPQTGADSILVSASFLGWPFALFKLVAAFITGILGGWLVNLTERWSPQATPPYPANVELAEQSPEEPRVGVAKKLVTSMGYSVHEILGMINTYLVIGVLLAALLGVLLPDGLLEGASWAQGTTGMLLILLISVPLYVCAVASVPIAASLVAAGMPVATALVFLMAGPAVSLASLVMVWRGLGRRVTLIYLAVVIVMSMVFAWLFSAWFSLSPASGELPCHTERSLLDILSVIVLVGLSGYLFARRVYHRFTRPSEEAMNPNDLVLMVGGMTCQHCTANVKRTLESEPGVREALPDLVAGRVIVRGEGLDASRLAAKIREAGYVCEVD